MIKMKNKKWKPWEMPSEGGLLGIIIKAGGDALYEVYSHDLETEPIAPYLTVALFPVYLIKYVKEVIK